MFSEIKNKSIKSLIVFLLAVATLYVLLRLTFLYHVQNLEPWGYHCQDYNSKDFFVCIDELVSHGLGSNRTISTKEYNGILYLKTHKTGSSTLAGILWRQICSSSEANCFLPSFNNPGKVWDFDKYSDRSYALSVKGTNGDTYPFDAWLYHAKMHPFLTKIVKQPHLLISAVRNPVDRFRSAWKWYKHEDSLKVSLVEFLHSLSDGDEYKLSLSKKLFKYRTGLDATTEELIGHDSKASEDDFLTEFIHLLISMVEEKTFIVVTDRFDESILVLQRLLRNSPKCMSSYYITQKVNHSGSISLTAAESETLRRIQPFDSKLFEVANKVLDRYIDSIGRTTFQKELAQYQNELSEVQRCCEQSKQNHSRCLAMFRSLSSECSQSLTDFSTLTDEQVLNLQCDHLRRDNRERIQSLG